MCVSPYITTDKYGNLVPVPCGHCFQCLQQWSRDWRFRLRQEKIHCAATLFLTLTYNDEHVPVKYNDDAGEWQSYVEKKELQNYFKRLRKNCPGLKFRYFAIGEYGGDYNRAHYHVVFFFQNTAGLTFNQMYRLMLYCWQGRGFIYLKSTSNKHINYVSGYFNKIDKSLHIVKPFKLMSKSIGLCYLTERMVNYFFDTFKTVVPNGLGGHSKLPRYYRKKLDEITDQVVPENYGYVWSDIAYMNEYKPKGVNVHFKYFCDHYPEIFKKVYRQELHILRTQGISIDRRIENPNYVFGVWRQTIPDLVNALTDDYRNLDAVKVQHKYTRLNEQKILYG